MLCGPVELAKLGQDVFAACDVMDDDIDAFLHNVCYPEVCAGTEPCKVFETFVTLCKPRLEGTGTQAPVRKDL